MSAKLQGQPSTVRDPQPQVTVVTKGDLADTYIRQHPDGLPQHLSGWRDVLRRTYGHQPHFLIAQQDEQIVGTMPLFEIRSRIIGSRLTTMPGGLCADSEAVAEALWQRAEQIALDLHCKQLTLHDTRKRWQRLGTIQTHHVHWQLDLPHDIDEMWRQLDGNLRRQVRKARKNGLSAEIDRTDTLLDPFYHIIQHFTRSQGTPVFPKAFLNNIINTFPNQFNICIIWKGEEPIAGYFQLELADRTYGVWGAALREQLGLRPSHLAIWELLRHAIERDHTTFCMGRSAIGSPASKFKQQWGGTAYPISQQSVHFAHKRRNVEHTVPISQRVQSRPFQLFRAGWERLPLPVTRTVGSRIRYYIPFG